MNNRIKTEKTKTITIVGPNEIHRLKVQIKEVEKVIKQEIRYIERTGIWNESVRKE